MSAAADFTANVDPKADTEKIVRPVRIAKRGTRTQPHTDQLVTTAKYGGPALKLNDQGRTYADEMRAGENFARLVISLVCIAALGVAARILFFH